MLAHRDNEEMTIDIPDRLLALFSTASTNQLVALGQITLSFSAVDETITNLTIPLLPLPEHKKGEGDKAYQVLARLEFKRKIRLLRKILPLYAAKYGRSIDTLDQLLQQVLTLADHRNDLIHGWISWDRATRQAVFPNAAKDRFRSADPKEIEGLNEKLRGWLKDFLEAFEIFVSETENAESQKGELG